MTGIQIPENYIQLELDDIKKGVEFEFLDPKNGKPTDIRMRVDFVLIDHIDPARIDGTVLLPEGLTREWNTSLYFDKDTGMVYSAGGCHNYSGRGIPAIRR